MKHTTLISSLLSCVVATGALALAPAAAAQNVSRTLQVNIPFAFQVDSQRMPAGIYHVDLLPSNVIELRGPTSRFVIAHSAETLQKPSESKIVFDRYGSRNYLHQIWTAGNPLGRECSKSRAEKEAMLAQNNQPPTLVELALIDETRR